MGTAVASPTPRDWALRQAERLARRLLDPAVEHHPHPDLANAVSLIADYVYHLRQPSLAVDFALQFHETVEIWSEWAAWGEALDTLLNLDHLQPTDKARLLLFRGRAARGVSDLTSADSYAQAALDLAISHQSTLLQIQALNQLGRIAFEQDDYIIAKSHLEKAKDINDKLLSSDEGAFTLLNLGNIAVQQGDFLNAIRHFEDSKKYYHQNNNLLYESKAICNIADILSRQGKTFEAKSKARIAIENFKMIGAKHSFALAHNDLGYIHFSSKEWHLSEQNLNYSISILEEIRCLTTKSWVIANIVELYVTIKQYRLAKYYIREGYELAEICKKPLITASIYCDHGLMLFEEGDVREAHNLWIKALRIQEEKGAFELSKRTKLLLQKIPTDKTSAPKPFEVAIPPQKV